MSQKSWRHHYIPKFYLKGFTSKSGKFKIYDVKKKRFVKGGKNFSPESYFFEKDANTVHTSVSNSDFIEKHYSKLDSDVAEVFNRINNSSVEKNFNIDENDIALLEYFVGVMYWRLPNNYEEIRHLLDRNTLRKFGIIIENAKGESIEDIELEEKLKKDINFFKAMKYSIPSILYPNIFHCNTPIHILSNTGGLPAICSDNPIIVRDPDNFRVYKDDFIFPLTNTKVLIRGTNIINMVTL